MLVLMSYVVSFVPYNICFNKSVTNEMTLVKYIDAVVDIFFFIDIIINFISAYDDPETSLPVVKYKKIAKSYMKMWFWIDLITVMPFNMLESMISP